MTHVEPIELNRKSEELSEKKDGIENHMLCLLEYIGTGNIHLYPEYPKSLFNVKPLLLLILT